jgi:DNA-binding LytR/AlgR family response regulator
MINVLIIEDDQEFAQMLKETIEQISREIYVCALLTSVKQSIAWFLENDMPNLIFSDIELTDGLSFEIFRQVAIPVPVIFITGHDQYSLRAFEANGIDYLLKPVDEQKLRKSIDRLLLFNGNFNGNAPKFSVRLNTMLTQLNRYKSSILVYSGIKIIPVSVEDIYFVQSYNTIVYLNTSEHRYEIKQTLNALVEELDPHDFYRANRQFIISRRSIVAFEQINGRKLEVLLIVLCPVPIVISKERVSDFLRWMKS